jgi:hypothetical protein
MKIPAFLAIALATSISAVAQTSPPAAPTLTAGAEFKGLRFDWGPVAGATSYQLEYRAHQTGSFVKQADYLSSVTSTNFSFPLHLFDWTYARYRLAACNSAGCSRSAEVSVSALRRDAVGYFKAAQPDASNFGDATDLSGDGYNFAVSAPYEHDYPSDNRFENGGAAYIFRRGSNGQWFQRARLELNNHALYGSLDADIAISGTGNTVAVGMGTYWVDDNHTGQVDVYYGKGGTQYSRTRIPRPVDVGVFGSTVALSESGYILAIGVQGGPMSVAIYKSVNGVWQNVHNLPAPDASYSCDTPVMSRDGRTIAELCDQSTSATQPRRSFIRVHSGSNWSVRTDLDLEVSGTEDLEWQHDGFAIDGAGGTIAVQFFKSGAAQVRVYTRDAGGYSPVATLTPGAWRTADFVYAYGKQLSLSGDGHTLAVGDTFDNGTSGGPRAAPLVSGTARNGAVYVYRLTDTWKLANMVKPNYVHSDATCCNFGSVAALSQTGKTLIVPMTGETSSAKGIGGDWDNANVGNPTGAVFMY